MPQTVANYIGTSGGLSMHIGCVALRRPQLAAMAMHVIEIWSYIDARIIQMAARFMRIDIRAANTMLLAIENMSARRAAIRAAASHVLDTNDFCLFKATLHTTKTSEQRRHQLAHHLWAVSDRFPDDLLLIDPKHETRQAAHIAEMQAAQGMGIQNTDEVFLASDSWENTFVCKLQDFKDDIERAAIACRRVTNLDRFLTNIRSNSQEAESIRARLLAEPEIERAYKKEHSSGSV